MFLIFLFYFYSGAQMSANGIIYGDAIIEQVDFKNESGLAQIGCRGANPECSEAMQSENYEASGAWVRSIKKLINIFR